MGTSLRFDLKLWSRAIQPVDQGTEIELTVVPITAHQSPSLFVGKVKH
jgi:hypothetical protein